MTKFHLFKSSSFLLKYTGFVFIAVAFFYIGKRWSDDNYQQVIFFNPNTNANTKTLTISFSPNLNKTFDIISSLTNNATITQPIHDDHVSDPVPQSQLLPQSPPPPVVPAPPPAPSVQRMGLVDENGVMRNDFEVGEFDPDALENWNNETDVVKDDADDGVRVRDRAVRKFEKCSTSMREYIPCLDNVEAIKKLKSVKNGEKFERHCPEKEKGLNCLVPAPKGYKAPIPWPRSRDEVVCFTVNLNEVM